MRLTTTAEVRLDQGKAASSGAVRPSDSLFWLPPGRLRSNFVAGRLDEAENHAEQLGTPGNVGWMGAAGATPPPRELVFTGNRLSNDQSGPIIFVGISPAPTLILAGTHWKPDQAALRHRLEAVG